MPPACDPSYVPTPSQIAAACEEIRRGWSCAEHRRRAGAAAVSDVVRPWFPPQIEVSLCLSHVRRAVLEMTS